MFFFVFRASSKFSHPDNVGRNFFKLIRAPQIFIAKARVGEVRGMEKN